MLRLFEFIARACFWSDQRRVVSLISVGLGLVALGLIAIGRPDPPRQVPLRDATINDISSRDINQYVRVTGVLAPNKTRQVQFRLGSITLSGSRYIPLIAPGIFDPLYVLDQAIPEGALTGSPITLVGKINIGLNAQHPTLYLEIGSPPNEYLLSQLARSGIVVLVILAASFIIRWLVRRLDYAIPVFTASKSLPPQAEVFWFGDLGHAFDGTIARFAPVHISAKATEAQLTLFGVGINVLSITIRRLGFANLFNAATAVGALPAARIEFEDERGLRRKGTLVFTSSATREVVLDVLRYVGQ